MTYDPSEVERQHGPRFAFDVTREEEQAAEDSLRQAGLPVSRDNVRAVLRGWARAGIKDAMRRRQSGETVSPESQP